jgi:hypothetical protein
MPGAITRQINGKLAQSKTKGKAFLAEMAKALSPEAIVRETPKTQGKNK